MTILQELISLRGEGRLTYSQEGFLASHFQRRESEGERKMTVTSGRKCFGQYGRYDPLGSLVRTLLESPAWYNPAVRLRWKVKPLCLKRLTRKRYSSKNTLSRPSAEILSVRDIPSSRFLFQLAVSEPRTGETGYGSSLAKLWKTPVTSDASDRRFYTNSRGEPNLSAQAKIGLPVSGKNWEKLLLTVQTQGLKVCDKDGKTKFMNLSLLPTPTAQEGFNSGKGEIFVTRNNTIRIRNQNDTSSRLGLEGAVKHMLYPTPTAQDFRRRGPNSKQQGLPEAAYKDLLPTPKANSWKTPCKHGEGSPDLQTYIAKKIGETSQLNPLFVEDMMGYPLMWTTLPFLSQNGDKSQ